MRRRSSMGSFRNLVSSFRQVCRLQVFLPCPLLFSFSDFLSFRHYSTFSFSLCRSSHCVSSSRSSALHINHMAGRIKQSICNSLAASLKDRQRSASITANASTSSAHGRVWVCVRAHVCVCICINSNRWLEVHARTERGHEALKMDRYLVV